MNIIRTSGIVPLVELVLKVLTKPHAKTKDANKRLGKSHRSTEDGKSASTGHTTSKTNASGPVPGTALLDNHCNSNPILANLPNVGG